MREKTEQELANEKLVELRSYYVIKANELIQRSRFSLQLQEQKVILYLISKIKPSDMELKEYIFDISDFCKVCGIEYDNGANYKYIRQTLKDLRDKSIWITLEDDKETTLAWIDKVTMSKNSGKIAVRIDDMLKPYLLQLKERFTQYELLYTLAMKSQYSIRLYELLKSYEYQHRKIFEIGNLKTLLSAENYSRFPDFKRKVLDISMREINSISDINTDYTIIKEGRKYAKLEFKINLKTDFDERLKTLIRIDEIISPGQVSVFEKMRG